MWEIINRMICLFQISCKHCDCCFANRRDLYQHKKIHHVQIGSGDLQDVPFSEENAPWRSIDGDLDIKMKQEYEINKDVILHKSEEGK